MKQAVPPTRIPTVPPTTATKKEGRRDPVRGDPTRFHSPIIGEKWPADVTNDDHHHHRGFFVVQSCVNLPVMTPTFLVNVLASAHTKSLRL